MYRILVVFLLIFEKYSTASKYKYILEDDEVFSACPDKPNNTLSVKGLFDFTELSCSIENDKVLITGNVTCIWDIQPTDRVMLTSTLLRFDRGSWQGTVISITVHDACRVFYDEKQYWYNYWTKYIKNSNEVKDKCINVLGTKLIHEPFQLDMIFDVIGPTMTGRHKIQVTLTAFDEKNVERETNICVDIIGEMQRL